MTTLQNKATSPIAHLSADDIENLGRELDAIRQLVLDSRGEDDARYIRTVIKTQRGLEAGSRAVLLFSLFPPAWWIGTWEWDNASTAEQWKHAHNEEHHTYTNVLGKDGDLGYGIMRVDEDQRWSPFHLGQPLWNAINAVLFQYGIAAYDLKLGKNLKTAERRRNPEFRAKLKSTLRKIGKQGLRDYVVHPLLSGPSAVTTLTANLTANVVRNLWTHSVIMCGHFPEGVQTFSYDSIDGETRGQWYLRQMLGSANISGSRLMHLMSGNLSYQIEHHLFPDLPSNRYGEIAPAVKELFDRYGLTYTSGPLVKQVASAWFKVIRLSIPNDVTSPPRVRATAQPSVHAA
jgi:linoleoyl-CoA desaturase